MFTSVLSWFAPILLKKAANHNITNPPSEALKNLAEERNRLNALYDDADRLKNSLMKNSPAASTAAFSDKEKKEIKALYDSGLYTQKELAQQYGVSQSAISQTTKRSSD
jgi:DNA-directed RNA polymerase specialized sigma subunit